MKYAILLLLLFPVVASAQTLFEFFAGVNKLINNFLIPLLISLAVLFFVYNVVQYFIIKSNDPEGRQTAQQYMLWSIIAFVLIFALWAIVNFVITGFGFANDPCDLKVDKEYVLDTGGFTAPCQSPLPPNSSFGGDGDGSGGDGGEGSFNPADNTENDNTRGGDGPFGD